MPIARDTTSYRSNDDFIALIAKMAGSIGHHQQFLQFTHNYRRAVCNQMLVSATVLFILRHKIYSCSCLPRICQKSIKAAMKAIGTRDLNHAQIIICRQAVLRNEHWPCQLNQMTYVIFRSNQLRTYISKFAWLKHSLN